MKRFLKIVLLVIILLMFTTISNAATNATISLIPNEETFKSGDTVKVQIFITNFTREGTQKAVELKLKYDSNILQYKEIEFSDGWNGKISENGTGLVAAKSSQVTATEVIAEITFIVKQNASEGETSIIANEIISSADGDEVKLSNAITNINVIANTKTSTPVKTQDNSEDDSDDDFEDSNKYYSSSSSDDDDLFNYENTEGYISSSNDDETQYSFDDYNDSNDNYNNNIEESNDITTSNNDYPKTGSEKIIIPMGISGLISLGAFLGYKKYKMY